MDNRGPLKNTYFRKTVSPYIVSHALLVTYVDPGIGASSAITSHTNIGNKLEI